MIVYANWEMRNDDRVGRWWSICVCESEWECASAGAARIHHQRACNVTQSQTNNWIGWLAGWLADRLAWLPWQIECETLNNRATTTTILVGFPILRWDHCRRFHVWNANVAVNIFLYFLFWSKLWRSEWNENEWRRQRKGWTHRHCWNVSWKMSINPPISRWDHGNDMDLWLFSSEMDNPKATDTMCDVLNDTENLGWKSTNLIRIGLSLFHTRHLLCRPTHAIAPHYAIYRRGCMSFNVYDRATTSNG